MDDNNSFTSRTCKMMGWKRTARHSLKCPERTKQKETRTNEISRKRRKEIPKKQRIHCSATKRRKKNPQQTRAVNCCWCNCPITQLSEMVSVWLSNYSGVLHFLSRPTTQICPVLPLFASGKEETKNKSTTFQDRQVEEHEFWPSHLFFPFYYSKYLVIFTTPQLPHPFWGLLVRSCLQYWHTNEFLLFLSIFFFSYGRCWLKIAKQTPSFHSF